MSTPPKTTFDRRTFEAAIWQLVERDGWRAWPKTSGLTLWHGGGMHPVIEVRIEGDPDPAVIRALGQALIWAARAAMSEQTDAPERVLTLREEIEMRHTALCAACGAFVDELYRLKKIHHHSSHEIVDARRKIDMCRAQRDILAELLDRHDH